ncbi:hypothetical protein BDV36DRAFT_256224 [Aspergillus pseudocaelatus]|uniref:Uncharacterized protein n=1 Tax=Aspergillus pseudocaelatus TaxID=1825620 RepID=A0ABQ6WKT5_9EURO|nr:hypothetical protein BDV36DRAFT_256224 [Aspergillus pseudocaelatus]
MLHSHICTSTHVHSMLSHKQNTTHRRIKRKQREDKVQRISRRLFEVQIIIGLTVFSVLPPVVTLDHQLVEL